MLTRYFLFAILALALSASAQQVSFSALPKLHQLYARDAFDSAIVSITGAVTTLGVDSVSVTCYRNGSLFSRTAQPLLYSGTSASFSLHPKIHAEMANYKFEFRAGASLITSVDSVVCGDAFLIDGQSNAVGSNEDVTQYNKNSWIRSYSVFVDSAAIVADSTWSCAGSNANTITTGGWGHEVARHIIDNQHIPVCLINGAASGTNLAPHQRNLSLNSIYGRIYYRVVHAGLQNGIKALFWHQGESGDSLGYKSALLTLFASWKSDVPSIQRYYLFQTHPGCFTQSYGRWVREEQRNTPKGRPDISIMSTANVPAHDGCHYGLDGHLAMGNRLYALVARDLYGWADTAEITPPDIQSASFTDGTRLRVILTFDQSVFLQPDLKGFSLRQAFCLGSEFTPADSIRADTVNRKVFLTFANPVESLSIGYIPNTFYPFQSNLIYEGPWLVNRRSIGTLTFYLVPFSTTDSLDYLASPALTAWARDSVITRFSETQSYAAMSYAGGRRDTTWLGCVFSSLDPSVASVSAYGMITGITTGNAGIRVVKRGLADTLVVRVAEGAPDSLRVSCRQKKVFASDTAFIALYGYYHNANGVYSKRMESAATWQSSNSALATMVSGKIMSHAATGDADIIASYWGKSDTCRLSVCVRPAVVRRIAFQNNDTPFKPGWEAEYQVNGARYYTDSAGRGWEGPAGYYPFNYGNWGVDSLLNPSVFLMNTGHYIYADIYKYRVKVPAGTYILRFGIGANDVNSLVGPFFVAYRSDTLYKKPGTELSHVKMDTVTVTGDSGLRVTVQGGICFLEVLSADAGVDPDAADDGFILDGAPAGIQISDEPVAENFAVSVTPNPFNPSCRIRMAIPQTLSLRMDIFDISGRNIFSLPAQRLMPGLHTFEWNGRNRFNQPAASGTYFMHIAAGQNRVIRKLVLAR